MEEVKKQGMESLFCPYEQALKLKELGFDEECFGFYERNKELIIQECESTDFHKDSLQCLAPLWQQAFDWFREGYEITSILFSDGFQWTFDLRWIDKDSLDMYPIVQFPKKEVGRQMFDTYQEAQLACLDKLIENFNKIKYNENTI